MASSELSVMLTAKGSLESDLKGARDRVKDLNKEIRNIQASGGTVGEDLASEFRTATKAASKLGDELNETNKKIKRAASESTTTAGKIGKAWTKTASIFQNNVVAGISAASLALAGRQAIKAYAEAEKMQMQLNLAYEKFPALANASRASFDDLNMALMNATGADDDALAGAEALLARFNLTGQEIQRLIPLVNDYSIATGTDLNSAAQVIGKSLLGNARALKALGINFKATGNRGQDLAAIMEALTAKVGGTGDAFGQTAAGKMAIAQKNFENLQEEIGGTLVPALTALVSIVKPVTEWFTKLADPVKAAAVLIAGIGLAALIATPRIIMLKAAMMQAGMGVGSFKTGLMGAARFLAGPWSIAIVGATAIIGDYMRQQQDAAQRVDTLTGAMQRQAAEGLRPVAEAVATMFAEWSSGQGTFAEQTDALGLSTTEFINAAIYGGDALDTLQAKLSTLERVGGTTTGMARGLQWAINDTRKAFVDASGKYRDGETALAAVANVTGVTADGLTDVSDAAAEATAKITPLTRAVNRFNHALDVHKALRAYKKALRDNLKKPSEDSATAVMDSWSSAYSTFKDGSKAQANFVKSNFQSIVSTVNNSGMDKATRKRLLQPLIDARIEAGKVLGELTLLDGTTVTATINYTGGTPTNGYAPLRKATGGYISGPGTGTSDSIPAMLSNGEYVLRAAAVSRLGIGNLNRLNHADRMSDPALLSRLASGATPVAAQTSGPLIGSIEIHNPSSNVDVEKAVVRGLRRAERIKNELAGSRG